MYCRLCGKESKSKKEGKECRYFLSKKVDEDTLKKMYSDDITKHIWKQNEKIAEELGRTYYNYLPEEYNKSDIKKDSKENFGFNTYIDGIRQGLDIVLPMLNDATIVKINEKIRKMVNLRSSKK